MPKPTCPVMSPTVSRKTLVWPHMRTSWEVGTGNLLGNMGTTGNTRNIATGKTHWEHGNTKLEAPGKPNGNMGTWEQGN